MNELSAPFSDHERARARLNPTVAALMQRGLDSGKALAIQTAGYSLARLKSLDAPALRTLGLSEAQIASIHGGRRAALPFGTLAKVLWDNRYTCCVCRQSSLAVIVHHIDPWAESRDHGAANIAVLCLEHHSRAHRKGELEQNLSQRQLKEFKRQWELEVAHLDAKAILDASRIEGHHWWWFNHARLFELSDRLGIKLAKLPRYFPAFASGMIDQSGYPEAPRETRNYMYEGGDGIRLFGYMLNVLESVLSQTAVFNVSDDLDPGFLGRVISAGDIILVEGKHYFRSLNHVASGPGQSSEVRREANHVRVSFTIDRYEAVANSSWAVWLTGTKSAASILRVQNVERTGGKLYLHCTGLAMGSTLRGLSTRSYVYPTWKLQDQENEDMSDDWLDGFGDEPE